MSALIAPRPAPPDVQLLRSNRLRVNPQLRSAGPSSQLDRFALAKSPQT